MSDYKQIKPEQYDVNVFNSIGKDWMLVTAEKEGKVNTMTASWGGFGVLWAVNVTFVVIRPTRYTLEFMEAADKFSLTFFDESFREKLGYLGKVSGRDEDKIAKANLTIAKINDTPYFEEANTVIVCKKLYKQALTPDGFLDQSYNEKFYPKSDHHIMYVSEILEILKA